MRFSRFTLAIATCLLFLAVAGQSIAQTADGDTLFVRVNVGIAELSTAQKELAEEWLRRVPDGSTIEIWGIASHGPKEASKNDSNLGNKRSLLYYNYAIERYQYWGLNFEDKGGRFGNDKDRGVLLKVIIPKTTSSQVTRIIEREVPRIIEQSPKIKRFYLLLGGLYLYTPATEDLGFATIGLEFQVPNLGLRFGLRASGTNTYDSRWMPSTILEGTIGYRSALFVNAGQAWLLEPSGDGYFDRESFLMLGTRFRVIGKVHIDLAGGVSQRTLRLPNGSFETYDWEAAGKAGLMFVF